MEVKIYVDVLFLTNLVLDWLLLYITALLLRQAIHPLRLFCVAILGAAYSLAQFFLPESFLFAFPGKLLIGALMVFLTFRPMCFSACMKYICVFYVCLFVSSGAAFFFFYCSGKAADWGGIYRNGMLYVNFPVYLLFPLFFLCRLLLKAAWQLGRRITKGEKRLIRLKVYYCGKSVTLSGYYDSGNLLREKTTDTGVLITQWSSIRPLFHPTDTYSSLADARSGFLKIPYSTLGPGGILPAFCPDVLLYEKDGSFQKAKPLYLAIVNKTLDVYHNWDAILPHDFEGVNQYEKNTQAILPFEEKNSHAC